MTTMARVAGSGSQDPAFSRKLQKLRLHHISAEQEFWALSEASGGNLDWQTVCSLPKRRWLVPRYAANEGCAGWSGTEPHAEGRAMQQDSAVFVGLDTSKMKISVALAEEGRQGEVRFLGDIDHTPETVRRLVTKLAGKYGRLLSATRPGRPAMGCSGRSPPSGMTAPSLLPR